MTVLNMVPEFTDGGQAKEEVKTVLETEEKETPAEPPAESSEDEKKPAEKSEQDNGSLDELRRASLGLQGEIARLRSEIVELRGQKRELKKEELFKAEQKLDDLQDVNPQDASLIERVLRSKGYVTKDEASKMYYKSVQDEELAKFLEKYPEYKPQNDPSDVNWKDLQTELALYKMPENPHQIREILERAHKAISKGTIDRSLPVKKEAIKTASVGAGGTQRSSSGKTLSPEMRKRYEDGGWSAEEIKSIESRL